MFLTFCCSFTTSSYIVDECVERRLNVILNVILSQSRQYRPKRNVTFVDNGTKVSAYTPKTYVFLPEKSVGDPDFDMVTTVNIPAVVRHFHTHTNLFIIFIVIIVITSLSLLKQAVMNKIKGAGFWVSSGISMYMGSIGTTMFMTHTVNELLWGFKDPLLSRLKTIRPEVDEHFGLLLNVRVLQSTFFCWFGA